MKKIELEDIVRYRIPSNLKYSPDGKVLSFDVRKADSEKNSYHTDIHLLKDGKDFQLTHSFSSSSVLWDDDTHLIISREAEKDREGCTQLYRIDITGGEAEPWMVLQFALTGMKKAENGLYVAAGIIHKDDPDLYKLKPEEYKKKLEERKKDSDYLIADETPFWFNGRGVTNGLRRALFVIDAGKGKIRRLTAPAFDTGSFTVEGNMLYYSGSVWTGRISRFSKLYSFDLSGGKKKTLYGKNDRSFGDIFMMNGSLYVHSTDMKTYGVNETMNIYEVTGAGLKQVYKPEISLYNSVIGDTADMAGTPYSDGKQYYTFASADDHTELYVFDGDFNVRSIWKKPGMLADFAVKENEITLIYQDWNHVAELYVTDQDGKNAKQVTSLNSSMLEGRYIAEPHRIDFTSEGTDLHGWVLLPENFSTAKKYPAVLDIHGGPRCIYGETFFHEMQTWAGLGFVVMFANIRGSDGRGDGFADIRGQYGYTDFRNLMDFTDAVLEKYPNIDRNRLCETGGSYGGFMTNWIITHTDRFCACASQRSISNWISMTFVADIGLDFDCDQCGAEDCFDFEKQWEHSPLKYVKNAKTPTLFIHSDEDYRCPVDQGMQMMNALAANGVETRIVIFHGENHELSRSGKPQHRLRRLKEITDWFVSHTR